MALCRYMSYLPNTGRQKLWGWVRDGNVFRLDEQTVLNVLMGSENQGLKSLEATIKGGDEPLTLRGT